MKEREGIVRRTGTRFFYNAAALKDENDSIDREAMDKFDGPDEFDSGRSVFDILDSIQARPDLFEKVFKL